MRGQADGHAVSDCTPFDIYGEKFSTTRSRSPNQTEQESLSWQRGSRSGQRSTVGCGSAVMVSASESADRLVQHRTFVDAAGSAGVGHIVCTSFMGAAPHLVALVRYDQLCPILRRDRDACARRAGDAHVSAFHQARRGVKANRAARDLNTVGKHSVRNAAEGVDRLR
jgi:hypothetical protein